MSIGRMQRLSDLVMSESKTGFDFGIGSILLYRLDHTIINVYPNGEKKGESSHLQLEIISYRHRSVIYSDNNILFLMK